MTSDRFTIDLTLKQTHPPSFPEAVKAFFHRLDDEEADAALIESTSAAMERKLAAARERGYGGWHGESCGNADLHERLARNLAEGDMVDVINLASMILARHQLFGDDTAPRIAQPMAAPAILNPADLPRRALDANGKAVEPGSDAHVITHFPTAGLMFDVRTPKQVSSLKAAREAAAQCELLDRKGEWILGEDYELQLIADRRFHEPAVDPKAFPRMPSSGWIYTNRLTAWSSGHVWFVDLDDGLVSWNRVDGGGLVVPVLRVPPSQ